MQVGVEVKCIHTNFGGCGFSGFRDIATFKNSQISLSDHGLWSMVVKKMKWIELAQKFMQVRIDVKCMYTNFGGCGVSGFGDIATLKTAKFPFLTMDYGPWSSKN